MFASSTLSAVCKVCKRPRLSDTMEITSVFKFLSKVVITRDVKTTALEVFIYHGSVDFGIGISVKIFQINGNWQLTFEKDKKKLHWADGHNVSAPIWARYLPYIVF